MLNYYSTDDYLYRNNKLYTLIGHGSKRDIQTALDEGEIADEAIIQRAKNLQKNKILKVLINSKKNTNSQNNHEI